MKKTIIALSLVVFLVAPLAKAQTTERENINFQLINALKQVIALLIKQVELLTYQLQEQQMVLGKIAETPLFVLSPTMPKGIDETTNKNVREGIIYPSVKLEVHTIKYRSWIPDYFEEVVKDYYSVPSKKNGYVKDLNREKDKLNMLFSVGNPDENFNPGFTCYKTGDWEGYIKPFDHWESDIKVKDYYYSELGVECKAKDGYVSNDSVKVYVK